MSQQESTACVEATPTYTHALRYSHAYGTNISVWPSREAALVGACQIIVTWWIEIENPAVRRTLREHFKNKAWEEALHVWGLYQTECESGEELEVFTNTFETPSPFTMPPEEDPE